MQAFIILHHIEQHQLATAALLVKKRNSKKPDNDAKFYIIFNVSISPLVWIPPAA